MSDSTSLSTLGQVSTAELLRAARDSAGLLPTDIGVRPADRHPALVYLARLGTGRAAPCASRSTSWPAFSRIGEADHETFPWEQLRYQHTAAARAVLQEQYAPATANKILSALRGVLEEAWQLRSWARRITTGPVT